MTSEPTTGALHPDRALPADPVTRAVAREVLAHTEHLPIMSMHGHVDVNVFVDDHACPDPAELLMRPDHYLTRMLGSQGISRERLRIPADTTKPLPDPRATWRLFCENWHLFRGTPTRYWLTEVFVDLFGMTDSPTSNNADDLFDEITATLAQPSFRPTALLDRFGIELIATTDGAADTLEGHRGLATRHGRSRVIPTFRPDSLFKVASPQWREHLRELEHRIGSEITDQKSFLEALQERRLAFIAAGGRATDHASVTADTSPLLPPEAEAIFTSALSGATTGEQESAFIAHMLHEMARMSCEDGLTMQLHPGSLRDFDPQIRAQWGTDVGYDIPVAVDYARGLRPLLTSFGHHPGLRLVVFTLDEDTFSRELAPLAGVFPAMLLGAPWWFLDTPGGMRRFREAVTDTAGFYNTSGFVDDTRAFCSIPTRHNLARRIDAGYLATLVAEHRLDLDEAISTAIDLTSNLPQAAYPPVDTQLRDES